MSLDGYLAGPNDDLSFLEKLPDTGEDYGYHEFIADVDTVMMGRKTYAKLESMGVTVPHLGCVHYVFTRNEKNRSVLPDVRFTTEDPVEWVKIAKEQVGKSIYCDGGASLLLPLWEANLVDEWTISVIPVILGKGTRLFESASPLFSPLWIKPQSVHLFESGLIQMKYVR